ncbi:glycogen-binding subunit 76A [Aplysia californica]|uniref:Glycogen-binding subunit 76A n=1 Tax=Aplysia californica TaxID=6500 RepID=A0ABM0JK77_APLCA|nr:glycogen-binding subunit 76A [Aplysia californica]
MYFCPCSCNDPVDPEAEEHAIVSLPRNLSYVQESYLDRYSVSARFVHNPKIDRSIRREQELERAASAEEEERRLLFGVPRDHHSPAKCAQHFALPSGTSVPRCEGVNGSCCVHPTATHYNYHNTHSHLDHTDPLLFGHSSDIPSSPFYLPSSSATTPFFPQPLPHPHDPSSSPSETTTPTADTARQQQQQTSSPHSSSSLSPGSVFPTGGLLSPAAKVASRLSALLHTPPNESMDHHRDPDLGSSVDGDLIRPESRSLVLNPDHLSPEMDRGGGDLVSCDDGGGCPLRRVNLVSRVPDGEDVGLLRDIDDEEETDTSTDSQATNLFPKPFGSKGKTFFPRSDLDLSSSDLDDTEQVEENEEEVREENKGDEEIESREEVENKGNEVNTNILEQVEQVMESELVQTVEKKPVKGNSYESPDSDAFSEEGVFVNMDDLDSNPDKSATVSDFSDDTFVSEDSVFLSPDEGDLEDESSGGPARKMSLEEAISRAASDLSKISMFQDNSPTQENRAEALSQEVVEGESPKPRLATVGRGSPLRGTSGLKIKITDADSEGAAEQKLESSSSRTAFSDSPVYPDNEFNFSRVALRKSSSLKTNKTPPGTPHRKKVVRFADAMGLDLESVRHVLNMESPPKIPASAMADLRAGINEDRKGVGAKYLCPCFCQPGASDNFFQRVASQKVCLENAIITDVTITGFVRVANIAFHKSVRVRYTHNDWATFHDIAASYVQNSCDGPTDRFSFSIVAPPFFVPGCRLQFAVSFNAGGMEYWDNNEGRNYMFECFAKTVPTESETAWMHFL